VLVKNKDEVEYRDVTVGINNKIYAQILSGLTDADEIVVGQASSGKGAGAARTGGLGGVLGQSRPNLGPGRR